METIIFFRFRQSAVVLSLLLMGILTTVTSCKKDLQSPAVDQLTDEATVKATAAGSDTIPPIVKFVFPINLDTVFDSITIMIKATDKVGVTSVQLKVDGVVLGTKTLAPYSFGWNTMKVMNGSHLLQAIAKDAAGNIRKKSITVYTLNQGILPMEQDLIKLINDDRISRGIAPLTLNSKVLQAARTHSQDEADHNYYGHTGSDGSTLGTRLTKEGYVWTSAGENIAAGLTTAQAVFNSWINDTAKRSIMDDPSFKDAGVGCAYNSSPKNTFHQYWTLNVGTTQ